jgi:RND family efflux transporter MFP subunit
VAEGLVVVAMVKLMGKVRGREDGMGKRPCLLIAAILAIALSGCGNSTVASSAKAAPTTPADPAPSAPTSKPASTESSDILSVLSVEHQVDVATQRDGMVVSVAKDEGAVVKAGDILGQLDDRTLQMELIKAQDDLRVSENNVKYKEAEVKAKDAAYRRQTQLRALGLSSQADLDAAEFEAKGAEYDMQGYQALVESDQAEIRRIEIELDQTHIRAPFSGAVVRRYIREGEALGKGDKCFRVSQLAPLQVQFQVPESAARRPQRGAPVAISLVGDSNRAIAARIVKISPTVDPASDSYDVVAQLVGSRISDLRPGMAVRVNWSGNAAASPKP